MAYKGDQRVILLATVTPLPHGAFKHLKHVFR